MLDQNQRQQQNQYVDLSDQSYLCSTTIQRCRILKPSILNKSSIHSITLCDSMLTQLPSLSQKIQKLDLSRNCLRQFPLNLPNLKQLTLNNNQITKIPYQINNLQFLRILRMNTNHIVILPFLAHVRHLQLNNNPIKLITKRLTQSKMQHIQFDWILLLINVMLQGSQQQIFYALCDIIQSASNSSNSDHKQIEQFVYFKQLFNHRKKNNGLQMNYLLHKAIQNNLQFFVNFLKQQYRDINYNAMKYNNKFILQQLFQTNNSIAQFIQLFQLRRSNISQSQIYIANLLISCRYNNIEYFTYLTNNALKRHVIQQNQFELIQIIFKNFNQEQKSDVMLAKILQLANFDAENKKIFHIARNYTVLQAQAICQGIIYVLENNNLKQIFDFSSAIEDDILEPLLHFAMMVRKPELVKLILEKYNMPFIKNYAGKLAKTIRGSLFSRKLIWKYEKKYLKDQLQTPKKQKESMLTKKRLTNQCWFDIIYNRKTSQFSPILKQKQSQSSLMGPKIQILQKQMQQRYMLNNFNISPSSQYSILGQSKLDQTGIIYDYQISKEKKLKKDQIKLYKCQSLNNLAIYQFYQKSQLDNICKNYDINFKDGNQNIKLRNSYGISPWNICSGVSDMELIEHERQVIIIQKDKINNIRYICGNQCGNINEQIDIFI